jgi:hypothetical protein
MHVNTVREAFRRGNIPGAKRFGSDWRLPASAMANLIQNGMPNLKG